jgi:hypothetical protein
MGREVKAAVGLVSGSRPVKLRRKSREEKMIEIVRSKVIIRARLTDTAMVADRWQEC